ncbi:hypothetical protein PGPR2_09300 [Pseudomonas aeruginosa PGPR2]|nr:hypothetical protein PGPR2_09300 [Pseudomonas aeruginosa PGPR2]
MISREGAIGDMQVPADNRERLFALWPAVTLWAALPVG